MSYIVICRYSPPPGSVDAPGTHYTLRRTEPDRFVGRDAFRQYSFYRTPRGSEVAGDLGYGGATLYYRLDKDGDIFRALRSAVEKYDQEGTS